MSKCDNCPERCFERIEEPDGTVTTEKTCEEYCDYKECPICGERHDDYSEVCHKCAESEYTDALGLQYLRDRKQEKNFVDFFYNDDITNPEAITALLSRIDTAIQMDRQLNRESKERKYLKDFCLEDLDDFALFLKKVKV